jgi:CDGSH-type Zn-finger protein/uncharacterized Fe-S cluster protein YjdI
MTHAVATQNREQLFGLLGEAAEIEHDLMCCYLYAAFSLKDERDEGLLPHELEAIERWRRVILRVAIEEMTHLSLVANLLTATGGTPHFGRNNFPISAGYHPARLVLELTPFTPSTVDHFVFLERPEGVELPDGEGFAPWRYDRSARPTQYMPYPQDYDTVGELYRSVRQAFIDLGDRWGDAVLYSGEPGAQVGQALVGLPGLSIVTDRPSAMRALDTIVLQGEGAAECVGDSHYRLFCAIRDEYAQLRAARPGFEPARNVARNPVMRSPPVAQGKVWVVEPEAAELMDLANALYTASLRLLCQGFARAHDVDGKRLQVRAAVDLMHAFGVVATELTRYPAHPEMPGVMAGASFALLRSTEALPEGRGEWTFLAERARELADGCGRASRLGERIVRAEQVVRRVQRVLEERGSAGEGSTELDAGVTAAPRPRRALPVVHHPSAFVEEARTESAALRFETRRCIHARHCVLGEPDVFLANVEGPWLHPEAVSVEALVRVAERCPSGAITYERFDGGPPEAAPKVNTIHLRENGPLAIRASLAIEGEPTRYRATLCRCGRSQQKPFCDGSHIGTFAASAEPDSGDTTALSSRGGTLEVVPLTDGPLELHGNVEICAGTGRTVLRTGGVRLCRCGGSSSKPICDGTHARIGFRSA